MQRSWIERILPAFILQFIAIKVDTLDEFVQAVLTSKCTKVKVSPTMIVVRGVETDTVGFIADFRLGVRYTATMPSGRKIKYSEHLLNRFGSTDGVADARARQEAQMKQFLALDERVADLKVLLPQHTVHFLNPDGKIMTPEEVEGFRSRVAPHLVSA